MLLRSFLSLYLPEMHENPRSAYIPSNQSSHLVTGIHTHSLVSLATASPQQAHNVIVNQKETQRQRAESNSSGFELTSPGPPFRAYLTLIIGLLFQISLGILWAYGNVIPYIASYIAYMSHPPILNEVIYNQYYSRVNWSFFLLFTSLTFGVLLGGKNEIYFGPKIAMAISSFFVCLGFGGTFISLKINSIFAVLISYGCLFGFGIGLGYPIIVIVCMRWFPNTKGRVCGIVSGVFGGSPLLWDYLQTYIVNPTGIAIDPSIGYAGEPKIIDRIPFMFLIIVCIQLVMQIIAISIVTNPPWYIPEKDQKNKSDKLQPTLSDDEDMAGSRHTDEKCELSIQQAEYERYSLNMKQTLKLFTFWILWINNFLYSFVLMFIAAEWKEIAINYLEIDNDSYLAIIGSISAMFNGFGRFSWGFVYDYNKSFKISMGLQTGIVTIFIATLPLVYYVDASKEILFAIWIIIIWANVGCQYAFLPTCIIETFGAKYTGSIVGLFVWCEAPASLLVVVCTQFYKSLFNGWTGYCLFMAACCSISFILSVIYKSNIDRKAIIEKTKTNNEILDLIK